MRLLHVTHPSGFGHDTGPLHPERPARLRAAAAGVGDSGVAVEAVEAVPLERSELTIVHDPAYVAAIERFCGAGGGKLDADTPVSEGTWEAALAAAGAGPTAVARLESGFDGPAFVAVRPPGHHATADRAMGFCVFNNVAITAARLVAGGQRVAVVDWDVHHGNGTQEIFYDEPRLLYTSLHQWPFYPYEGAATEVGSGAGEGTTLNVPLPAFTAGDVYLAAYDELLIPALSAYAPDWVLVSSGFDAHAADPLAELRLIEADYAALAARLVETVPANRVVVFLEGGYHLPAIRASTAAVVQSLTGAGGEWETSPHASPPEARSALSAAAAILAGRVAGVD